MKHHSVNLAAYHPCADSPNIEAGVDDDGFIYLAFPCDHVADGNEGLWTKNYSQPIDGERARADNSDGRWVWPDCSVRL